MPIDSDDVIIELVVPENGTTVLELSVPDASQFVEVAIPGVPGSPGPAGPANSLSIGTITTLAAGQSATATISGTAPSQSLSLGIPRGADGLQGPQGIQGVPGSAGSTGATGAAGPANTLSVGTVTALAAGATPTVTITGTSPNQTLNIGIPAGATGATGSTGATGPANTLTIGTVSTLASGASATASITGTSPNQTLNIGIPAGAAGATGPANTLTIGTVTTGTAGSSASATITGTAPNQTLNLTIPTGAQGPAGAGAPDATTTSKGSIQLAGDLGGTADTPTVPGLAGKAPISHTHTASQISDSTTVGRSVLTAADAAAARTAIGAGTSNLVIGTTSTTAKAGDYSPPNATTLATGLIQLAGDLSGTATVPTVPGLAGKAANTITITAGTGLTGGGDLTANRTLSVSYGTAAGTAVQGNDTRVIADQAAGTASIRTIGTGALQAAAGNHTHTATGISDSTAVGRSVLTAVDAPTARTAIGAGTSNLAIGTTSTTAKAGDYQPTAANISDATAVGRSVLTAVDAPTARTAIGAGTSNLTIGTTSTTAKAGDYVPSDATTLAKGIVQLAGDLAGTAALPTVPGLANKAASSITITAGTGLTGGGDLTANRTLTVSYGTTAGTAVQGNDTRVVADQAAATASIRTIGTGALQAAAGNHTHTATGISDSTTVGRSVLTAADAPTARTAIGAGTSNLAIGTTSTTAKAGDYQPTAANISDSTTVGRAVLTAVDAPTARTAIGAGTSNLAIGTTSTTAKAGDYQPASTNISDSTAIGRTILTAADAAAVRTATGAVAALSFTATKTAAYTVAANEVAVMNVPAGATVLTLPTAPANGTRVAFHAIGATTAVPLTINRGGTDTIGIQAATSIVEPMAEVTRTYQYDSANTRWVPTADVKPLAALDARFAAINITEGMKIHDGTTGGGTRPTGYYRVRWIGGTTRPTNMITGDIWEHDA